MTVATTEWIIDQDWRRYTAAEHARWTALFDIQKALLPDRACDAFMNGLDALDLGQGGIPDFDRLNEGLRFLTGWQIIAVPGLVPDAVFFDMLARRRFPAGRFIRNSRQLDYLQEPDIFHDVFGHVPMLTDPVFADYMQAYGEGGLRALHREQLHHLARLYWHTVEFGLLQTPTGLRIYGAGIVSSKTETLFALENPTPRRLGFALERVMRTPYKIDDLQPTYFVAPSLDALLQATLQDFGPLYDRLARASDIPSGKTVASDVVF